MAAEKSPRAGPSSCNETGTTSTLRESSRQFMSSMLADEADFTHCTPMLYVHHTGPSPNTPKDSVSPHASANCTLKRSPGTVRVVEFTSQSKSYVSAIVSSTTTPRTSFQSNSTKETLQYVTEVSVSGLNGSSGEEQTSKSKRELHNESELTVSPGYCVSKSFVQQRIERLYGPGALAQGFFSRMRQPSLSEEESIPQSPETNQHSTSGNVTLPVLRHLRPEFRAQLPLTPSNNTRTSRPVERGSDSVNKPGITQPTPLQQQTSVESLPDSQPAAPEVPIILGENMSVTNMNTILKCPSLCNNMKTEKMNDNLKEINNSMPSETTLKPILLDTGGEEKNGHYFLKVLHAEIQRLNLLVESAEKELENTSLPEEAQGKLRTASGQARLLMKQKLKQFEGLCHKNINQSPDEVFPTTAQDLAGFWDMVKLQIDHVDRLFVEIDRLKNSGWIETHVNTAASSSFNNSSGGSRRKTSSRRPPGSGNSGRSKASDETKRTSDGSRKKEELAQARKRMMEERRRLLRQQQQDAQENVEIFILQENGK